MNVIELQQTYLKKVIDFCEAYDAFSIPAAMIAGGPEIRLQDVYTHLSIVSRDEYEKDKEGQKKIAGMQDINEILAELNPYDDDYFQSKISLHESMSNTNQSPFSLKENDLENESNIAKPQMKWFLSAPGGGKTTLLKMITLTYAYKIYGEKFGALTGNDDEDSLRNIKEKICSSHYLNIIDNACPVFIKVRDIAVDKYEKIPKDEEFTKIILESIDRIIDDPSIDAALIWEVFDKWVFIVDGVEEFSDSEFRTSFLKKLARYTSENHIQCYLSSRYREYRESGIKDVEVDAEEYVIEELNYTSDIVRSFAERWYSALNRVSGRKQMDVEKDFIIPLQNNSNIVNLVSNPLELTSLLMISSYDSCLPSDFAKIYGRSIELWLSWANHARYNFEDMMRQLSQVAYKMATSDNNKITVKHEALLTYLIQARKDLKRYYQQEWSEETQAIEDFITFLCTSHLISGDKTDGYEFVHRQYQAYLVSYCIKNNIFSRETRRGRFEYIQDHLEDKDDFWNQIIIIIAVLDIDLRDSIISELIKLSQKEDTKNNQDKNYYVSLLIQLAIIPGINFDSYELEDLYNLLVDNEKRWELFSTQKMALQALFEMNDAASNGMFIEVSIAKSKELEDTKKEVFRDNIATLVFYCMWKCDLSDYYIEASLKTYFENFINTNILGILYEDKKNGTNNEHIENIVVSLGLKAINNNSYSDYYMLIAAIAGYKESGNPYDVIDRLLKDRSFEANTLAINILVIAAWVIKCSKADILGYEVDKTILNKYVGFVIQGIVDKDHKEIQRDYMAAFEDLFAIGIMDDESSWFSLDSLKYAMGIELQRFRETKIITQEDGTFSKELEYISLFPCRFDKDCQKLISEFLGDVNDIVSQIENVFNSAVEARIKVHAFKLLILFASKDYNSRMELLTKMEKYAENIDVRKQLRRNDWWSEYQCILKQVKQYMPERDAIIDELDFPSFNISLLEDENDGLFDNMVENNLDLYDIEVPEYVDYYGQGKYEQAKQMYLKSFDRMDSRNNLAYMLRRGEIDCVEYEGKRYDVQELLEEGVKNYEPYSLINYALYISWSENKFIYKKGLAFLEKYYKVCSYLEAAGWWYSLKQNNELEGYVVLMWLSDMGLGVCGDRNDLLRKAELQYSGKIVL